jgi:hypothetical protein
MAADVCRGFDGTSRLDQSLVGREDKDRDFWRELGTPLQVGSISGELGLEEGQML